MKKIILDTDIGFDCDDAGALALLHRLCDREEAQLLAVTACYDSPHVAGCIDAINRYYKRPVPVGVLYNSQKDVDDLPVYSPALCRVFPNSYPSHTYPNAPDAVVLLRSTLANAPDHSVTLVIIGSLATAEALLKSKPDAITSLSGAELIQRKLDRTIVMGGRFFESWPEDIWLSDTFRVTWEWNIKAHIPAAQSVCDNWPGKLIFASYEIGFACITMKDFCQNLTDDHPVRYAYALHGSTTGRSSWDLTAVLEAVRPQQYFRLHPWGQVQVDGEGITTWHPKENGLHSYLLPIYDSHTLADCMDALILPQGENPGATP